MFLLVLKTEYLNFPGKLRQSSYGSLLPWRAALVKGVLSIWSIWRENLVTSGSMTAFCIWNRQKKDTYLSQYDGYNNIEEVSEVNERRFI